MCRHFPHGREPAHPDRRLGDCFRLVAALLLVMLTGWALAGGALPTDADEEMTLNIKVGQPDSQVAAASAACAELQVGQVFPVDVRVENVNDLMAYELRVSYDSTVLALEDADFKHFLLSTPPSGQIFPSLFETETANTYFLAAADTKGSPDSGSGVLARLQMRAIGEGVSEIGIQTDPTVYGPRLTDSKGHPIADTTGDRIFDGPVQNGTAAVNADCSSSGVGGGGTDPGSGGNDTEPGSGSQADTGDSSSDSGDGSVVATEGDGQDDEGADASGGGGSGAGNGSDSTDGGGESSNEGTDAEGGVSLSGESSAADSGDGSLGLLWYTLIALVAIAALAALGLVIRSLRAP